MEAEHTDLKTLKWDSDEDGVYLGGRLNISGATTIVAQCLSRIDAEAIVQACKAYESDQEKIKDLVAMLRRAGGFIDAIKSMNLVKPSAQADLLAEELQAVIVKVGGGL